MATITLAARHAKNRRTKVQPIQPDLAKLLRDYLTGRQAGQPIWVGNWARDYCGAEMLRGDLKSAGIPYSVDGPDGPLYADFHSLRHSYLTLGGRAGIDLRTLQELAGHSTPVLTARYSHRRLYDLAGAIEKLPSFLPPAEERPTGYFSLSADRDGRQGFWLHNGCTLWVHPRAFCGISWH
ncbi:MAG: tyrosine-type recombinase/integrase [Gemmataceae bacterium]